MEIWRDIAGYERRYQVSDYGNVRSMIYGTPHILKPMIHYRGHLYVHLYKDGVRDQLFIHRLVAFAFLPEFNPIEVVNHDDGDKKNNRADNLEWTSSGDNTRHYYRGVKMLEEKEMAF